MLMLKKILIAILLIVVFAGSGLLTFYGLRYGQSRICYACDASTKSV